MMRAKLRCVLLIDDNPADNYLHEMVLQDAGVAEEIHQARDGLAALEFLQTRREQARYPQPELIFLDLNMPRMDGWEFLEAYEKLGEEQRGGVVVVMLTTSRNPEDEERASQSPEVAGFESKPLTEETLFGLLRRFFPALVEER